MADFHDVRFPLEIARGARGGPQRLTEIVTTATGREIRNARWLHARRKYDAGYGIRSFADLAGVVAFFEERRGRLHGFRFRDRLDYSSAAPGQAVAPTDQRIGTGDGATTVFSLVKRYGSAFAPYDRPIVKPVSGTVRVAVSGAERTSGFSVDAAAGLVTFASPPAAGAPVTAGFQFDVPVRFDTDALEIDLSGFESGAIPAIPLIELVF